MIYISESELYKDEELVVDSERRWTVYYHQNKINGKIYVGITGQNVMKRWNAGHGYEGQVFGRAVSKYGWNSFEHVIFASNLLQDEAEKMESFLIQSLNTTDSNYGYNIMDGSKGTWHKPVVVYQYNLYGNLIKRWDDIYDAAVKLNIPRDYIYACCIGERKKSGGYIWRYEEDNDIIPCPTYTQDEIVLQFDLKGNFIKQWNCVNDVAKHFQCDPVMIKRSCIGRFSMLYGYIWLYKRDIDENSNLLIDRLHKYRNTAEYKFNNSRIQQFDKNGNLIQEYKNIHVLKELLGWTANQVRSCWNNATGRRGKTYLGFVWKAVPFDYRKEEDTNGKETRTDSVLPNR